MTAREYISEIKLRLARRDITKSIGDLMLLSYVNAARRRVQRATMGVMPERYGNIVNIYHTDFFGEQQWFESPRDYTITKDGSDTATVWWMHLPEDYIEMESVSLAWTGEDGYMHKRITRRLAKEEMYSVAMKSWLRPTIDSPVYAVERVRELTTFGNLPAPGNVLYLIGTNTGSSELTAEAGGQNVWLEVWYLSAIDDLDIGDEDGTIPVELEELVISYAILECANHFSDISQQEQIAIEIEELQQMAISNYKIAKEMAIERLRSQEGE